MLTSRVLPALAAIASLFLMSQSASAQDFYTPDKGGMYFSVSGTQNMMFYAMDTSKDFTITVFPLNLDNTLTLPATLTFTLGKSQQVHAFPITYNAFNFGATNSSIIVGDASGHDTISIHGRDTNFASTLYSKTRLTWKGHYGFNALQTTDTATYTFVLENTDIQTHTYGIQLSAAGTSVYPTSLTLQPNSNLYRGDSFYVTHIKQPGEKAASISISAILPTPPFNGDTVLFKIADSLTIPHDSASKITMSVDQLFFGLLPPGQSACKSVTIHNLSPHAATVTSITAGTPFSIANPPSFPFTIAGQASKMIDVCFNPFAAIYDRYYLSEIAVNFSDSAGGIGSGKGEEYGFAQDCIANTYYADTLDFGTVVTGTFEDKWISLVNHTARTQTVIDTMQHTGITFPDVSFPLTLKSGDSIGLRIRYTPKPNDSGYWYVYTNLTADCELWLSIFGQSVKASNNHLDLNPKETENIVIKDSTALIDTQKFIFYNTSGSKLSLTSVYFSNPSHFKVIDPLANTLPKTVNTGDSIAVSISFSGDTTGLYKDTLIVTADNISAVHLFPIYGFRTIAKSSVQQPEPVAASLNVYPNPSNGSINVRMNGVDRLEKIELRDILGNLVSTWDNMPATIHNLTSGTYFLRATGHMPNGRAFVLTQRVSVVGK